MIVPFKPAQVRVRVIYEGEEDKPLTSGTVSLFPLAEDGHMLTGMMRYGLLMQYQPKNSTYIIEDVPPGKYRVRFNNANGAYLKSIESGGQALDGDSVMVSDGSALDMKMIFSKNVASVNGDVEASDNTPKVQAILVPEDKSPFDRDGTQVAALDQSLHFSMGHLRPGKYLAFATEEDAANSALWDNPDFVKLLQAEGTELDLPENAHATVHLKVISKAVIDRIRQQLGI